MPDTSGLPALNKVQEQIYVPFVKRNGEAMIKISSPNYNSLIVGQIAMQVSNQTFEITHNSEKVFYEVVEKDADLASVRIQLSFKPPFKNISNSQVRRTSDNLQCRHSILSRYKLLKKSNSLTKNLTIY